MNTQYTRPARDLGIEHRQRSCQRRARQDLRDRRPGAGARAGAVRQARRHDPPQSAAGRGHRRRHRLRARAVGAEISTAMLGDAVLYAASRATSTAIENVSRRATWTAMAAAFLICGARFRAHPRLLAGRADVRAPCARPAPSPSACVVVGLALPGDAVADRAGRADAQETDIAGRHHGRRRR